MAKEAREFQVQLVDWKRIPELPDGWTPQQLLSLLTSMEVDGVSEDDALEMTILALQDLDVDEASDRVLEAIVGESMRSGVKENLAHDLTEDRPWEQFADIAHQKAIFTTVVLLHRAFPREFGRPEVVSVTVRLDTESEQGKAWLDASEPDSGLLLRILAAGMDDNAVLKRLFDEALRGRRFPEAGDIIWHVSRPVDAAPSREFTLISSHQWFDPLEDSENWTALAWRDAPAITDEPEL